MLGRDLPTTAERPPPFNISAIMNKVIVYTPAERAGTLPLFPLYPYTVCTMRSIQASCGRWGSVELRYQKIRKNRSSKGHGDETDFSFFLNGLLQIISGRARYKKAITIFSAQHWNFFFIFFKLIMTYYKLSTDLCQIRRYTTKVPSKQSLVVLYACVTDIVKSIDSVVAAYFRPLSYRVGPGHIW